MLTLGLWFFAVLGIWGVEGITSWLNSSFQTTFEAEYVFLFFGLLSGLSLGSSQSASRALVGLFTPEEKSAEFLGFWGLSNQLAGVFGIVGLGLLQAHVGLHRSVVFCAIRFLTTTFICF